jgi:hypothetical protein
VESAAFRTTTREAKAASSSSVDDGAIRKGAGDGPDEIGNEVR